MVVNIQERGEAMEGFKLLRGMELGAATAATQIEGGECGHNWNDWYRKGRIKDGSNPALTTRHYDLWKQDCDLMKRMGLQVYRMGIEWSRLEPEEGNYDQKAFAHYREEILYLRELGIKPLLTLHHFTNPMWFEEKGGFSEVENSVCFLNFVKVCLENFYDIVSEYITINEPNVYATSCWFYGEFPPGGKSITKAVKVMSVMAHCHIEAYRMIHDFRCGKGLTDTRVSFVHHMRVFVPKNKGNLWHRINARLLARMFQGAVADAMFEGRFGFPFRNYYKDKRGNYCDFIGINYYSRSTVSGFADGVRVGVPLNDLGWEIYPEGIAECAKELYARWPLPVYITENGTCDNEDAFRSRYIYDHLKALCDSGLPVERYYHWCFCDNFEWAEGESARFGIVHTDYSTQARTIKNSGNFYSAIIAAGGVDQQLYSQYAEQETYHM